jgi:hypothetical protein
MFLSLFTRCKWAKDFADVVDVMLTMGPVEHQDHRQHSGMVHYIHQPSHWSLDISWGFKVNQWQSFQCYTFNAMLQTENVCNISKAEGCQQRACSQCHEREWHLSRPVRHITNRRGQSPGECHRLST